MAEKEASILTKTRERSITIEMRTPIDYARPVYLAGDFNHWRESDVRFQLHRLEEGRYQLQLPAALLPAGQTAYKYVRGAWSEVELDRFGNATPNRLLNAASERVEDFVPRWRCGGRAYDERYLPNIQVISETFEIPQLIRTRRIAALLPHDYYETDRRYPVLYLQDGQNLFDDYAPFGNWAVDKKLAILAESGIGDIIIIAIDHAEEQRIAEFTPSMRTRLGSGEGKKYVRFLADTLKPYVDSHFRTLTDRQHTGIGGSSMGGLISIYAGLMYPEVYSRLMVFSPSLWVAPQIHFHYIDFLEPRDTRIYLYAGASESANMVPNIQRFKGELEKADPKINVEFKLSIDPEGEHNEERWGREFPPAVEWLFFSRP